MVGVKIDRFSKKKNLFFSKKDPVFFKKRSSFSKKRSSFFKKRTKLFVKKIQILKVGFKIKFIVVAIYLCNLAVKILHFVFEFV